MHQYSKEAACPATPDCGKEIVRHGEGGFKEHPTVDEIESRRDGTTCHLPVPPEPDLLADLAPERIGPVLAVIRPAARQRPLSVVLGDEDNRQTDEAYHGRTVRSPGRYRARRILGVLPMLI